MKIGFEAKRAFHNSRGLGNYARTLIDNVQRFYPDNEYYLFTPPAKDDQFKSWFNDLSSQNCFTVSPHGNNKIKNGLWRTFFSVGEIEKLGLDVFHGLSHELPYGIHKLDCKKIVTIHDVLFIRNKSFFNPIDRLIYLQKYSYSCKAADKIIALSDQTKYDLIELLKVDPSKIDVIPQSNNFEIYQEPDKKLLDRFELPLDYIFFVGAFERNKNIHGIIHAFNEVKNETSKKLVLAGNNSGKYYDEILGLIQKLDLSERIKFVGKVSDKELNALYSNAFCTMAPSFYEGWGLPVVESQICGTPVITSNVGSLIEAGGEHSLKVDPNNYHEIGDALRTLLNNEDQYLDIVKKGEEYIKNFLPENLTEKIIKTYS